MTDRNLFENRFYAQSRDMVLPNLRRALSIEHGNLAREYGQWIPMEVLRDTMRLEITPDIEEILAEANARYQNLGTDGYQTRLDGVTFYTCRYVPAPGWRIISPLMAGRR